MPKKSRPAALAPPSKLSTTPGVPRRPIAETLLALEPRYMFDAAGAATAAEVAAELLAESQAAEALARQADQPAGAVVDQAGDGLLDALVGHQIPAVPNEIIFIDSRVDDYDTLIAGLDANIEVVMHGPNRDGLEQIAETLEGRTDVAAIHIVAHGDAGRLELGDTALTTESMQGEHADDLALIQRALTEQADLLIYGCNFAQGAAGREAADLLAGLIGADVAASDDLTGSTKLGGDWQLEFLTGDIDSGIAFTHESRLNFSGVLNAVTDIDAGGDLEIWLDGADVNGDGTNPANGANVITWTDKSGNANDATHAGATNATYDATARAVVNPGGADSGVVAASYFTPGSTIDVVSYYLVVDVNNAGDQTHGVFGNSGSINDYIFLASEGRSSSYAVSFDGQTSDTGRFTIAGDGFNGPAQDAQYTEGLDNEFPLTQTFSYGEFVTDPDDATPGDTMDTLFAFRFTGTEIRAGLEGNIHEVLAFDRVLNSAERNILDNYFSDKWGVDLDFDEATERYDPTGGTAGVGNDLASGLRFDIAGIGLEADGSVTTATSGGITVTDGTTNGLLTDNGDYLMVGHNNSAATSSAINIYGSLVTVADRLWFADVTQVVGSTNANVDMAFDLSAFTNLDTTQLAAKYVLLYDSTGDGVLDMRLAAADGKAGSVVTFTDVDASTLDGAVFSVALDLTEPAAPVVTAVTTDTGVSAVDGVTSDNTLLFSGTAEATSSVEVFLNAVSIGTTTANAAGAWTFDHTAVMLGDGLFVSNRCVRKYRHTERGIQRDGRYRRPVCAGRRQPIHQRQHANYHGHVR